MPLSASEIVEKQIRRASAAQPDYVRGVTAPERNPIEAALAKAAKYQARMREALDKKRWEAALGGTPKTLPSERAASIGADRFVPGIEASRDKITRFQTNFKPLRDSVRAKIRALPDETEAQREARVLENLRGLRAAKGAWRR